MNIMQTYAATTSHSEEEVGDVYEEIKNILDNRPPV